MGDATAIITHVLLFITLYFEVFLLIAFLQKRDGERALERAAPKTYPKLTVMVPCYNEEKTVLGTVFSLLRADYPKSKLEVIVIDDGSTDGTRNVLRRFKNHKQVILLAKENGGKHSALNFGLEHATGEIIGCLDADSFIASHTLKALVAMFNDQKTMAVTPAIAIHEPRSLWQFIQKAEYSLSVFIRKAFASIDAQFITPGALSLYRKEVFDRLGPYKSAYNTEDLEIAMRMQKHGLKIANTPLAHVHTRGPKTLRALYRQRVRWTYGFLKNAIDYKSLFFSRKHGTLGVFILPVTVLSIFFAFYFTGLFFVNVAGYISSKMIELQAIGVTFGNPLSFAFEPFFISTQSVLLMVYLVIACTFLLIVTGKILSKQRSVSFDTFTYLFLYGFLAPWWLARAVYNVATAAPQKSWTAEIDARRES